MGVTKQKYVFGRLMTLWKPDEENFVKDNYPMMETKKIAEILQKSISGVKHKAWRLGVKKNNWIVDNIKLSDREIAYLAATIDCDGSIMIMKGSGTRLLPLIQITNTNLDFLKRIKQITGGFIVSTGRRKRNWSKRYDLKVEALSKVYPILKQVVDDLIIKKKQAELLIKFCANRLNRENESDAPTKEDWEIREKIKELNKRGVKSWA